MEVEESRPAATIAEDSAGYVWTIRLAAGMFTLLQVLTTISAATSAYPAVLTMQRSLVNYKEQGGGVSIDHLGDPLFGLFLVTYASALACLIITLGFAWYAGRVVKENGGGSAEVTRAGTSVALTAGLVWLFIGIPLVLITHADGTIAWLVATSAVIRAAASGPPTTSVYVTSPGLPYLLIQLVALLLQLALFLTFALPAAAIAGRIGAGSVRTAPIHNAG